MVYQLALHLLGDPQEALDLSLRQINRNRRPASFAESRVRRTRFLRPVKKKDFRFQISDFRFEISG
jgi:hypothetical protein